MSTDTPHLPLTGYHEQRLFEILCSAQSAVEVADVQGDQWEIDNAEADFQSALCTYFTCTGRSI